MSTLTIQNATMVRKLWLFTGGAFAVYIANIVLSLLVPSFLDRAPLVQLLVYGIWSALILMVLLAEARRIHKIAVLTAVLLAVTLSFSTRWFGFTALLLGELGKTLLIVTVLVLGVSRLLRKQLSLRTLVFPLTIILVSSSGLLLSAFSSKPAPPIPQKAMGTGEELKYIFDTDQADRYTGYMWIDPERDRIRLERVKALYRAGQITKPVDQLHAAMVYQHASCADDFQVAYELAKAAEAHAPTDPTVVSTPPLSHRAYDRWQMSLGKPQTYGTHWPPVPIKRPCAPVR